MATQIPLMLRTALLIIAFLGATGSVVWLATRRQNPEPEKIASEGETRVRKARAAREVLLRERVRNAGLIYPPRQIFLRAFKQEAELELWGRESEPDKFRHIVTWPILKSSGRPGPKRREGDRQVPEGVYFIDRFNPESSYHLSLGINYPNASDRLRGDRTQPGSDIFIHGNEKTIGCLPLGDPAIEELYLIAFDTHRRSNAEIAVHIFPARMAGERWSAFVEKEAADDATLRAFWEELRPIYDAFEQTQFIPIIEIDPSGSYRVKERP